MSSLVIQNSICVLPVVFGAAAVKKGYEDFKNDHRVYGIAKMAFGTLLAGAGIGFAIYNASSQEPAVQRLESCDTLIPLDEQHPSCPKIFELTHNVLNRGELEVLGTHDKIPKLSKENYVENLIACSVQYDPNTPTAPNAELDCHAKLTKEGRKVMNVGKSGLWVPPDKILAASFFKQIPGCDLIYRLQVHINTK